MVTLKVPLTPPTSVVKVVSSTVVYHSFSKVDLSDLTSDHHSNLLCKAQPRTSSPNLEGSNSKTAPVSAAKSKEAPANVVETKNSSAANQAASSHTSSNVSHSGTPSSKLNPKVPKTKAASSSAKAAVPSLDTPGPAKAIVSGGNLRTSEGEQSPTAYISYVIGITPTYYRMTQRLDLTSLCQTLMNVPRFLWIVVEDANSTSSQVRDILSHCRVSVFSSVE